ncbi:fibronectin type III domain-containing protein [Hymenobacter telluris]|uniref:fibronectin type III domain-containing protein n=1 Tax=Hymenobacter telluris TaxID=2816474 RepID=UPI001A8F3412|nr:fibronectin type III domain-containing protein [Hymenobacter telluris]
MKTWHAALTTSVLLGASLGSAQAQIDTYQFAASQGTYAALPATATPVSTILSDDAISGAVPIGFSFSLDGLPYTTVQASSNGFLSFNSSASSSLTNELASPSTTDLPLLAPLWDDLSGSGAGAVASYQTTGTAPNRVFTFEWLNWKWNYSATGPVLSMQVKLYETTNRIEYIYRPETTAPNLPSASIGLAGGTPSSFLSLNSTAAAPTASAITETSSLNTVPAAGQVYAFTPAPPSACPTPRNLTVTGITANSATLNWTVTGGGGTFVINYGPAGFTPGTGGQSVTSSTTSVTVTGLTPSTEYQFYVTQLCAGGVGSVRSNAGVFRSDCVTPLYATVPFQETFENTWISRCNTRDVPTNFWRNSPLTGNTSWRREDDGVAANWSSPTSYAYSPTGGQSSDHSARFHSGSASSRSVGTLDLFVNLSAAGNKELSFEYLNTSGNDSLTVQLSTDGGVTFGPQLVRLGISSSFQTRTLQLTSTSATAVIRFRAVADFGITDIGLDNVTVASCARVSGVAVNNITGTSATVTFTPVTGVTSYTVVATPATGTPVTVAATGSPVQLTGLQGLTQYTVGVVSNCGPGQTSVPVTATFTTLIPPSINDEPCGAVLLTTGPNGAYQTIQTTNLGATTTAVNGYANPGCTTASAPKDVWYRFVVPATGSTSMSLVAIGNPAGQVRVFSAASCSGPFTQISCKGGTAPNTAAGGQVLTSLTPGATYYVSVSGYSSSDFPGSFSLQLGQGVLATRNELPNGQVAVYPNPSNTGQLTLRIAGATTTTAQASLFNALGQQVLTQAVSLRSGTAEQPLAVRTLAKGLYTLRVQVDGLFITRKVVLE